LNHAVRRKLTTIFCADVVGYSRMMGANETGTLKLLKECRELVAAFIDRHRGRVVSWSGDAVLADFGSVVEAVQCAVEIQRELKARNDGKAEGERMEFRIGINLGDVMIEDHDIFGEGVNIASRLQSLAVPGGILISGSVHDQVKNKLSLGFSFMGHQQVKNIADHVAVFGIAHEGAPVLAIAGGGAAVLARSPGGGVSVAAKSEATPRYAGFMARAGAGFIDLIAVVAISVFVSVMAVAALGDVVEIDDPIIPLAVERTIASDLPSTEIAAGGRAVKTTQSSVVERNFFGLATQTVRRTRVDLTVDPRAADTNRTGDAADIALLRERAQGGDVLIDPKSRREIGRPALSILVVFAYFLLMGLSEGLVLRGSSLGKMLFGLRVKGTDGERITLARAFVRNIGKILSLATVLIGFLMVLFTKHRQALHDMLADAVVVNTAADR
jgi:class 3 adenylate cyclase